MFDIVRLLEAFKVLGPWATILLGLMLAHTWYKKRQKNSRERRATYIDGVVVNMKRQVSGLTDCVGLVVEEKKGDMPHMFIGRTSVVPYSIKIGTVVRIKYLLSKKKEGFSEWFHREILDVVDFDAQLDKDKASWERLNAQVKSLRGGNLPEATRDPLA